MRKANNKLYKETVGYIYLAEYQDRKGVCAVKYGYSKSFPTKRISYWNRALELKPSRYAIFKCRYPARLECSIKWRVWDCNSAVLFNRHHELALGSYNSLCEFVLKSPLCTSSDLVNLS